jgi:DMSO reductase anchor subunit
MRPTFSIIAFTVLSGIGYGAWFLLGLGIAWGPPCGAGTADPGGAMHGHCPVPFATPAGLFIAFVFVGAGLLCSLGHLGRPGRAWRALSQWRSSWLSREGVTALATFVPATLLLARQAFLVVTAMRMPSDGAPSSGWLFDSGPVVRLLGLGLAAGSLLTVICTANIYASLKPIRAWHERHVVPVYLLLGFYGGGLLLLAATTLDDMMWRRDRHVLLLGAIVLAALCAWIKHRYWRAIDAQPVVTTGHATGLAALGNVRPFEAPHTEENYLVHEMGFVLARRHARKLRHIALVAGFLAPALLAALALAVPATQPFAAWLAFAAGVAGLFVERWLFFAEARHAVMAYYRG